MALEDEGFEQLSTTTGTMKVSMMGDAQEMEYEAENHINRNGTIVYANVTAEGTSGYIFYSKTPTGEVVTMPGDQTAAVPLPMEEVRLKSVDGESDLATFYMEHMANLGDDEPVASREELIAMVDTLPQHSMDLMSKAMEALFSGLGEGMGQLMSQMGDAMGEALGGAMGDAMGDAMGEMLGAMGEGMNENAASMPDSSETPVAVPDTGRYCPACGAQATADATECAECGEELD